MAKFDSNRILPGTISFTRDATTGEFKIQQQGFLDLPDLSLPTIDQADYDTGDGTTTPPDSDTPTPEKTLPFIPGGDDKPQPMMDVGEVKTFDDIQKQAADFAKQDIGIDRTSIDQGAIQVSGLNEKEAYDKAVASYNAIAERNRELGMGRQTLSTEERLQNKVDLDAARNRMDYARKSLEDTFETIKAAPVISEDLQKFGPKTVAPGTLMGAKTPDIVSDKFKYSIGPQTVNVPEVQKNLMETTKDLITNSATVKLAGTGMKAIGAVAVGVGDALLGVTDVDRRRREADSSAAKSLGLKTVGELGGSTDPGRIAMSPNDHVFGGMNRDSAKGNLSQGAANRIETRMTVGIERVEKRYGANSKQANDFRQKTKDFQKEANDFNSQKEKEKTAETKSQNPNLRAGAGGEGGSKGGGKIVCTMMNESYGFGSFRNKIWMKFHGNILPEYQKGYHKLFLPLVNYAKQKGITNKIIKNILEHIAVHSTIDMRQTLRGKTHILGRVYRKVILPLCYWAGRK